MVITKHQPWHPIFPKKIECKQIFYKITALGADYQQALSNSVFFSFASWHKWKLDRLLAAAS
ncbi:hypothetical protein CE195_11380 [Sodalis-like symbiont of Philaenus spumarius]|nr:hypothetical protein CE195_11380 [Sodalis-like symbiont of Philaenus spumarius]